jgi:transcriptional regulator with AAA-type ATPase domain
MLVIIELFPIKKLAKELTLEYTKRNYNISLILLYHFKGNIQELDLIGNIYYLFVI